MMAKREALIAYAFGAASAGFGAWASIKGAPGPWALAFLVSAACYTYGRWLEATK